MMRQFAIGLMALAAVTSPALACTPNPDPDMRSWAQRVAGSSPMFIGTVVEIRGAEGQVWHDPPVCETPGATRECEAFHRGYPVTVVFEVEVPINGVTEPTFTVEQGRGSDCMVEFRLGQRWLYAGNLNESPSMYLNESYDWQQAANLRKLTPVKLQFLRTPPSGGTIIDSTLVKSDVMKLPAGVGLDPDTPTVAPALPSSTAVPQVATPVAPGVAKPVKGSFG